MTPGVHLPIAVAIIDGFDRSAVRIGKVYVEICPAPQRLKSHRVPAVLPIDRYLCEGYMIIPGGWTAPAVFTPISVRCLLLGSKTMQNPPAKIFPFFVPEHSPRKKDKSSPGRKVVRRGPNIRCVVPG